MKTVIKFALILLIILGISEPVFAMTPAMNRPKYYREYNFIRQNHCVAVSMIPYSGDVLYECPYQESFWSDVLVPSANSPLFMYFKNRQHEDDDTAEATAVAVSSSQ
jgi:hypothetical protein